MDEHQEKFSLDQHVVKGGGGGGGGGGAGILLVASYYRHCEKTLMGHLARIQT